MGTAAHMATGQPQRGRAGGGHISGPGKGGRTMTWRERIVAARERGKFTTHDTHEALGSWFACAVGEQKSVAPALVRPILRPDTTTGPADDQLYQDGMAFGTAVAHDLFDVAEKLLDAIEDRVLELKRQHNGA